MEKAILKKVYNIIKCNVPNYGFWDAVRRSNKKDSLTRVSKPIILTQASFPIDFSLKFEDLADVLTELDTLKLIKYDGQRSEIIPDQPAKISSHKVRFFNYVDIDKFLKKYKETPAAKNKTDALPGRFEITLKDREVWINSYLLAKPHAVGVNYEFLE